MHTFFFPLKNICQKIRQAGSQADIIQFALNFALAVTLSFGGRSTIRGTHPSSLLPVFLMNENDSEEWLRSSIWDSPAKAAPTQSPGLFPAWMAFLDGITNSINMNLSKVWEIVEDREAWRAAVHPIAKCSTWLRDWTSCPGHGYSAEWGWGYLVISQAFLRLTEWLPALPQSCMPKSLIPNTPESSIHLDLSAVWWIIEFLSIT